MSGIQMDPGLMRMHAEDHRVAGQEVEDTLNRVPTRVDGGIASDVVVAIMDRIATAAGDMADVHLLVGAIIDEVVTDTTVTDEATAQSFQDAVDSAEDD
jgi:hypothetical protein